MPPPQSGPIVGKEEGGAIITRPAWSICGKSHNLRKPSYKQQSRKTFLEPAKSGNLHTTINLEKPSYDQPNLLQDGRWHSWPNLHWTPWQLAQAEHQGHPCSNYPFCVLTSFRVWLHSSNSLQQHSMTRLQVVRIFTSSTFTDMLMERNTLMEFVYPRIREYCRERYGIEFQVSRQRQRQRQQQKQRQRQRQRQSTAGSATALSPRFQSFAWIDIVHPGCRHALGSAGWDDQRAYDHWTLHEGTGLLSAAFYRSQERIFCMMWKFSHVHILSRAQLHLFRWSKVWLSTGSSCCGLCRTEVVEGDTFGNGDRCDPARQVYS